MLNKTVKLQRVKESLQKCLGLVDSSLKQSTKLKFCHFYFYFYIHLVRNGPSVCSFLK